MSEGFVALVGAGPGDPGLLTLAARDRLARADVVIVGELVNPAVLMHCPAHAEILQPARGPHGGTSMTLGRERVNALMVEHARAGRYVVRLEGGDPMMCDRGAEEAQHLARHGVRFEVVPGVSSSVAAPEAAGIPITDRAHTPSVNFVSGDEAYEEAERRALFGRRVVVTRAARQAGGLVKLLAAEGADAVAFPCLEFVDALPEQREALDRALTELERFHGLIVSSPNGVEALAAALARSELDARSLAGKQLAAIGTGTAARLRQRGLRADVVPDRARAEGLIDALRERGSLGRAWLQIRADEGRGLLGRAIAAAGGSLELVVGYRTVRPAVSPLLLRSLQPVDEGGEGYDAICFASARTARHFLDTSSEAFGSERALAHLEHAKVIAIGPVTADAISALGVEVHGVATQPSDAGMLAAVLAALAEDEPGN